MTPCPPCLLPFGEGRRHPRIQTERDDAHYLPGDPIVGRCHSAEWILDCGGSVPLRAVVRSARRVENDARMGLCAHSRSTRRARRGTRAVAVAAARWRSSSSSFPARPPDARGGLHGAVDAHSVVRLSDGSEMTARKRFASNDPGDRGSRASTNPSPHAALDVLFYRVCWPQKERIGPTWHHAHDEPSARSAPCSCAWKTSPLGDDYGVRHEWNADTGMFRAERQPGGQGTTMARAGGDPRGPVQLAGRSVLHVRLRPREAPPSASRRSPSGRGSSLRRSGRRAFHEVIVHTAPTSHAPVGVRCAVRWSSAGVDRQRYGCGPQARGDEPSFPSQLPPPSPTNVMPQALSRLPTA